MANEMKIYDEILICQELFFRKLPTLVREKEKTILEHNKNQRFLCHQNMKYFEMIKNPEYAIHFSVWFLTKSEDLIGIFKLEKSKRGRFTYKQLPKANVKPAKESYDDAVLFFKDISGILSEGNKNVDSKGGNSKSSKLDLRVGKILKVEEHPNADKLFVFKVDLGERDDRGKDIERTIVAGLRGYYRKEELEGKKTIFVANLEPVKLRGVESNGMILAAVSKDRKEVVFLKPKIDIEIPSNSITLQSGISNKHPRTRTNIINGNVYKTEMINYDTFSKYDIRIGEIIKIDKNEMEIKCNEKNFKLNIRVDAKKNDKIVIVINENEAMVPLINDKIMIIPEKDIKEGTKIS